MVVKGCTYWMKDPEFYGSRPVVSLSFEHHAGDSTILSPFHPNFEEEQPGSSKGPFTFLPPATNLPRGLAARRLFRVPPCREETIHSQTSMPSLGLDPRPTAPQSTTLNTIPEGRHISLYIYL
ncbi:hypothetical protein TNCV_1527671 [Trichonephila clavipes]|nr:hypothetical protein TNCV_1527671 [Trichonephila clavipes]